MEEPRAQRRAAGPTQPALLVNVGAGPLIVNSQPDLGALSPNQNRQDPTYLLVCLFITLILRQQFGGQGEN